MTLGSSQYPVLSFFTTAICSEITIWFVAGLLPQVRRRTIVSRLSPSFPKRVFLDQAYSSGRKLATTVIDRERKCVSDCYVQEVIGIELSEREMVGYAARGIDLEISGRRASVRMSIPAAYFAAVLEKHRSIRAAPGRRPPVSAASVPAGLSKTIAVGRL